MAAACSPVVQFYHSEKLQSTKTVAETDEDMEAFYHSEKLQSTKTKVCAEETD